MNIISNRNVSQVMIFKINNLLKITLFLLFISISYSKSNIIDKSINSQGVINSVFNPSISVLNINNMAYWIEKSGAGTIAGSLNGQQADYPIFTGGLIYEDGMLWGVKASEYPESSPVRVGGSTYYKGMKAGFVVHDSDGNVVGADDPVNHHVWRVRTDFMTADLTKDAANFYASSPSDVSAEQIQNVYDQYESDWMNWPAAWGAPYENNDGVDGYDPSNGDIPGYPGADQTVWTISNDVPTIVDASGTPTGQSTNTAPNLYGADPVGVELRVTIWGYAFGASDPLGNVVFKKTELTYTGLETSSEISNPEVLDSVYFTQWSDPDLGTYTDDYVGTDVDLSLGFVYNGNTLDGVFNGLYNLPVPAGGYDFLQGPADNLDIDGDGDLTEYLPLTSFTYFGAGSSISDPDLSSYNGSLQFFNLMEGYLPRPEYPTQVPYTDPLTNENTKFVLSGDPVSGTGWVDGIDLPPGDRRLVMSSGPFSLSKGGTQEIVVGLIASQSTNNIESLKKLKLDDEQVQIAYDTDFNLLGYNLTSTLSIQNTYILSLSLSVSDKVSSVEVFISNCTDNQHDLILNSANNFSDQIEVSESNCPYTSSLVINLFNGDSFIIEDLNQKPVTWSPINFISYQVIYDNFSNDGFLNAGEIANITFGVSNSSSYPVENLVSTVIDFEGPIDYYENPNLSFENIAPNEAAISSIQPGNDGFDNYITFKVSDEASAGDSLKLFFRSFDLFGNTFENEYIILIDEGSLPISLTPNHVSGGADGNFEYRIVRAEDITGDEYQITFSEYGTNQNIRSTGKIMEILNCSGSSISGTAMEGEDAGTIDLILNFDLVCPGGAWVDGIQMTFPDGFSSSVNSWGITGGGNVCSYGTGSGQNCDNLDGSWDGDVLLFGNDARTGFGAFESSNVFTVNYNPSSGSFEDITISYIIYDDGYDGTVVDGEGTFILDEFAEYLYGTLLMNIQNISTDELVYRSDIFPNQDGSNFDIIDGFKLFQGSVIYDLVSDFNKIDFKIMESIWWDPANHPYQNSLVSGYYDIDSYAQNGWALTARAVDTWGSGITSVDYLKRDIEIRFTGEFQDTPTITDAGVVYYPALAEGGSYAWIDGSRISPLSDHPDPTNPGDGSPFRIKIPFEVWDMEAEDGPTQIDITIYDRMQSYSAGDTVYAFNPYDRMYTHFIHLPYNPDGNYGEANSGWGAAYGDGVGEIEESLTWNLVWWDTQFDQGDKFRIEYLGSISTEDRYLFTPSLGTFKKVEKIIPNTYSLNQNYPNPFNPNTIISYGLPKRSNVNLIIYDILGREIISLINENQSAGNKVVSWHGKDSFGRNLSAGMYIYAIQAGEFRQTKKMVLLK